MCVCVCVCVCACVCVKNEGEAHGTNQTLKTKWSSDFWQFRGGYHRIRVMNQTSSFRFVVERAAVRLSVTMLRAEALTAPARRREGGIKLFPRSANSAQFSAQREFRAVFRAARIPRSFPRSPSHPLTCTDSCWPGRSSYCSSCIAFSASLSPATSPPAAADTPCARG